MPSTIKLEIHSSWRSSFSRETLPNIVLFVQIRTLYYNIVRIQSLVSRRILEGHTNECLRFLLTSPSAPTPLVLSLIRAVAMSSEPDGKELDLHIHEYTVSPSLVGYRVDHRISAMMLTRPSQPVCRFLVLHWLKVLLMLASGSICKNSRFHWCSHPHISDNANDIELPPYLSGCGLYCANFQFISGSNIW
jgi:hypothetical protein